MSKKCNKKGTPDVPRDFITSRKRLIGVQFLVMPKVTSLKYDSGKSLTIYCMQEAFAIPAR